MQRQFSPYQGGSPYGASPYYGSSPYAASPYGASPYAASPYAAPYQQQYPSYGASPYASAPYYPRYAGAPMELNKALGPFTDMKVAEYWTRLPQEIKNAIIMYGTDFISSLANVSQDVKNFIMKNGQAINAYFKEMIPPNNDLLTFDKLPQIIQSLPRSEPPSFALPRLV